MAKTVEQYREFVNLLKIKILESVYPLNMDHSLILGEVTGLIIKFLKEDKDE